MILPDTNILIAYFGHQEPATSIIERAIREREIVFSTEEITLS